MSPMACCPSWVCGPYVGRWFTRKDDSPGSPGTVMLSYGYWQRKFGGDPVGDRPPHHGGRQWPAKS